MNWFDHLIYAPGAYYVSPVVFTVVAVVGLVMTRRRLRHHGRAGWFAAVGFVLLLAPGLLHLKSWALAELTRQGYEWPQRVFEYGFALAVAEHLARTAGFALLTAAVFTGRRPAEAE